MLKTVSSKYRTRMSKLLFLLSTNRSRLWLWASQITWSGTPTIGARFSSIWSRRLWATRKIMPVTIKMRWIRFRKVSIIISRMIMILVILRSTVFNKLCLIRKINSIFNSRDFRNKCKPTNSGVAKVQVAWWAPRLNERCKIYPISSLEIYSWLGRRTHKIDSTNSCLSKI